MQTTWVIVVGLWILSFLIFEGYALAIHHIPWLRRKFPRLPVLNTLSQNVWDYSATHRWVGVLFGSFITLLAMHFFANGWCAP